MSGGSCVVVHGVVQSVLNRVGLLDGVVSVGCCVVHGVVWCMVWCVVDGVVWSVAIVA